MEIRRQTIEEFTAQLSSKAPTPGGRRSICPGRRFRKCPGTDGSKPDHREKEICGRGTEI